MQITINTPIHPTPRRAVQLQRRLSTQTSLGLITLCVSMCRVGIDIYRQLYCVARPLAVLLSVSILQLRQLMPM